MPVLLPAEKQGRTTYLTLNRAPLAQLQGWVSQFHPYWGSDEATYENYMSHLSGERQPPPAKVTRQREKR